MMVVGWIALNVKDDMKTPSLLARASLANEGVEDRIEGEKHEIL
jgi:hypothetical protein